MSDTLRRWRIPYHLYAEANRLGRADGFPVPRMRRGYIALYIPDPRLRRRYSAWKVEVPGWDEIIALRKKIPPYYRGKIEEVT